MKNIKELRLSNNLLTSLPEWLGDMGNLTVLYLHNNLLSALPESIRKLSTLKYLQVHGNKLHAVPDYIGYLKKLTTLSLSDNQLTSLPESIKELKNLKELTLHNNQLDNLPQWLEGLESLEYLVIRNLGLTTLPFIFSNFSKIKRLWLDGNNFHIFPKALLESPNLQHIELEQVSFAVEDGICLTNNPISDVPHEVMSRGLDAVREYFKTIEKPEDTIEIRESKLLIVGEPQSGKTTFTRKIRDENAPMPTGDESTRGIDIVQHNFDTADGKPFTLNIWDFAGQDIYSATHRFFLTKRSLYVLLTDNRDDYAPVDYWVDIIHLLAADSPVLVLQNEKSDRFRNFDLEKYQAVCPRLLTVLQSNLLTGRGLAEVRTRIETEAAALPLAGFRISKKWQAVREALRAEAEKKPYVPADRFTEICMEQGIESESEQNTLSDLLHDLGAVLRFREHPLLERWIFLRPVWATGAVYKIIDSRVVQEKHGYFEWKDVENIWQDEQYRRIRPELMALMAEFKLCFEIQDLRRFVAPALLLDKRPDGVPKQLNDALSIELEYDFLPKGLLHHFIVDMHRYLRAPMNDIWASGALLETANAHALAEETASRRQIRLSVAGQGRRELAELLIDCFGYIHDLYPGIVVRQWLRCSCTNCQKSNAPHRYELNTVLKRLRDRKRELVQCIVSDDDVDLRLLLENHFTRPWLSRQLEEQTGFSGKPSVFISYAHLDEKYRDELRRMLSVREKQEGWQVWDDQYLLAGEQWNDSILRELEKANVILLLISADFFHSDFCYGIEMRRALERHHRGEALIVPVVIRACDWKISPLGKVQAPLGGKPVSSLANRDEAWNEVVQGIVKMVEQTGDKYL
ncbi:MAG: leucine-rich repeat domain-containing protein [Saprospiraceae bacterium]|nr:leucine-rich repeat domain-containing protein [Saprospiraceae bacterium]